MIPLIIPLPWDVQNYTSKRNNSRNIFRGKNDYNIFFERLFKDFKIFQKRYDEAARIAKKKFLAPAHKMPLSVQEANNQMCNNSQLSYISFNNDVY